MEQRNCNKSDIVLITCLFAELAINMLLVILGVKAKFDSTSEQCQANTNIPFFMIGGSFLGANTLFGKKTHIEHFCRVR